MVYIIFEIFTIFLSSILLFIYYSYLRNKKGFPINWSIVMLPSIVKNVHKIHVYFIKNLEKYQLTFQIKFPWFTNMQILATADPANVHHMMSKNFSNYPKGSKLKEIFEFLGDAMVNTDSWLWKYNRKLAQSLFFHPMFLKIVVKKTWDKVENGLIPLLDHVSKHGIEIDLQDVFSRFAFDTVCTVMVHHDPRSLSIELPKVPSLEAMDDLEQAVLYRHVMPTCVWKLLRWLDIGVEKRYRKGWQTLDSFIYKCIALLMKDKKSEVQQPSKHEEDNEVSTNTVLLTKLYNIKDEKHTAIVGNDNMKFLRDTIMTFIIGGRDTISVTLSWFFYLLSKNPKVLSKVNRELDDVTINKNEDFKEVSQKLIYLHATLCETLRLYPPIAFEAKTPIAPDILPSGHQVKPNMQIIVNIYAMGRMKSIWGDDCYEFKPERWISDTGKIKYEPSYKFLAFNSGPRTCVGKDMAFTEMKIVAATIIKNYVIEPVKEIPAVPDVSIVLRMKYGLKVKVSRRQ